MPVMTYMDAINTALREEMARDERVFIIGEDVGIMGGAFKATKGLQDEFGKERVIDSPLAEGVIVSSSIGAAMAGMRPVAEIQFADFITPAMDPIAEQAAKLRYRSAGTQTCPLTIRVCYGGGVGGGLYHSQTNTSWFIQPAHQAIGLDRCSFGFSVRAIGNELRVVFSDICRQSGRLGRPTVPGVEKRQQRG
jgi:2-oxoisovalerate dehydrogenase E1 component beta subunit